MIVNNVADPNRRTSLLVLEGDGIGPESTAASVAVLKAADEASGLNLHSDYAEIGLTSVAKIGSTIFGRHSRASPGRAITILGPSPHNDHPPVAEGGVNPSGTLRKNLDLYTNITARPLANGLFAGLRQNEQIIDAMAALLVRDASWLDVIETTNMFGDILSDQASESSGNPGLAASINAGANNAMRRRNVGRRPALPAGTSLTRHR